MDTQWPDLINLLKEAGVTFAPGLSDGEIATAEERFGFRFPPDHREFLQTALPVGDGFLDWRSGDLKKIAGRLDWPLHGILFDIEHNDFWLPEWGLQPELLEDRKSTAEMHVKHAPKLIPVYSHRMIPDRPHGAGNPVLSVYQTDIIYYGFDLDDYYRNEFNLPGRESWPAETTRIELWDSIIQFRRRMPCP